MDQNTRGCPSIEMTRALEDVISVALFLLQRSKSYEALTRIGNDNVAMWKEKNGQPILPISRNRIMAESQQFLAKLNARFIPIVITDFQDETEILKDPPLVRFKPEDWLGTAKNRAGSMGGRDVDWRSQWDPHKAGEICFNKLVSRLASIITSVIIPRLSRLRWLNLNLPNYQW